MALPFAIVVLVLVVLLSAVSLSNAHGASPHNDAPLHSSLPHVSAYNMYARTRAKYVHALQGGVSSAYWSTRGEIDNNTLSWSYDRPHEESFFFPSACPTEYRACCLSYDGDVCGGPGRGSCTNVTTDDSVCMQTSALFWFTDYFDYVCVCEGNFWGPACEYCQSGWTGANCDQKADLLVRRDFATLSDVDKQYVIDGFRLAKITPHPYQANVSLFDFWAVLHHWSLPDGIDYTDAPWREGWTEGHDGVGAILYHRAMVGGMERALQTALQNDTFALPYWNWTSTYGTDNDETLLWFGGDGNTTAMANGESTFCRQRAPDVTWLAECDCEITRGPFKTWKLVGDWGYYLDDEVLERGFGCQSLWAPSPVVETAVSCAINMRTFATFQPLLGGGFLCDNDTAYTWPIAHRDSDLHLRGHRWLGGSLIGHHPGSDPLFWLFHSYADWIFEAWIRTTTEAGYWNPENNTWASDPITRPGDGRTECQGAFFPLQKQELFFTDSRNLGFTYDFFEDPVRYDSLPGQEFKPYSEDQYMFDFPEMNTLVSTMDTVDEDVTTPDTTKFFVPSTCSDSTSGSCCPTYNDEECGGSSRGVCVDVTSDDSVCDMTNHAASLWWFTTFYTKACVCNEGFTGPSCGECDYGYTGDDCSEVSEEVRVRKNFALLASPERNYYTDAFRLAYLTPSMYQPTMSIMQYYASLMYWALPGHSVEKLGGKARMTYSQDGALTWYRTLLLKMEHEMAVMLDDSSFAIPYWKWDMTKQNDNDPVMRYFGGAGSLDDDNFWCGTATLDGYAGCNCSVIRDPFAYYPTYGNFGEELSTLQRSFGCFGSIAASPPTRDVVDYVLTLSNYYSIDSECFSRSVTGDDVDEAVQTWPPGEFGDMLARLQNWIGGTMTTPDLESGRTTPSSPASDPLYWVALSYVDLIFEQWIRQADANEWDMSLPVTGAAIGLNSGECMPAIFPLTTNAEALKSSLDSAYTYDILDTSSEESYEEA